MAKYEFLAGFASSLGLFAFMTIVFRIFSSQNTASLTTASLFSNLIAQLFLFIYAYSNDLKGLLYPIYFYTFGIIYILYVKIIRNKEYL
mgnify:CR=1 FL=1